jgi:hypothetical protein
MELWANTFTAQFDAWCRGCNDSLLASGYSMEDIAEMAKKKVARDKDSDVKMLKDLLGDL